jgi:hypothetical protein
MRYFSLILEAPGEMGPKTVHNHSGVEFFHLVFRDWAGDDMVSCSPAIFVSRELATAMTAAELTGIREIDCEVQDRTQSLPRPFPEWQAIRITGTLGTDDFSRGAHGRPAVSERALTVIRRFHLKHAEIFPVGEEPSPEEHVKLGADRLRALIRLGNGQGTE